MALNLLFFNADITCFPLDLHIEFDLFEKQEVLCGCDSGLKPISKIRLC